MEVIRLFGPLLNESILRSKFDGFSLIYFPRSGATILQVWAGCYALACNSFVVCDLLLDDCGYDPALLPFALADQAFPQPSCKVCDFFEWEDEPPRQQQSRSNSSGLSSIGKHNIVEIATAFAKG